MKEQNSNTIFKAAVKSILRRIGGKVMKSLYVYPSDISKESKFIKIYEKCQKQTRVSVDRSFALYKAIQYVVQNNIPGDLVECGVWKGGQAMLIAYTLIEEKNTARKIFLYDTYTGMSKPDRMDIHMASKMSAINKWENNNKTCHNAWWYASLDEVKENMFSTGYLKENIMFIKGKVEETIPETMPEKIALLRLDTDFYESTYHELKYLYPLLQAGGVLIIDDYGTWEGSKKAVDQYFDGQDINILLHRIGPGRIGIKT